MVVCSCNVVTTEQIKDCLEKKSDATAKDVLEELDWKPECSVCVHQLVNEIEQKLEEVKNGA